MNNEEELILNEVIKKHNKLKKSIKKFNDCNFDYEDKMYIVCDYITDLVEDNEKNVDTIHELVNIIQEAIRTINDLYNPSPKIMKIKKILLKYKENNYDVK